jgi:hypothetical protein
MQVTSEPGSAGKTSCTPVQLAAKSTRITRQKLILDPYPVT